MKDELISKVMDEVMKKMGVTETTPAPAADEACCEAAPACNLTEFVGTALGHTIGLVIANLDHQVHEQLKIDPKYRAIGIISDRVGAGPQIFAADEAVKATNSECLLVECPRDTEGGAGHGCFIVFGAEDVSDVRRAVEVTLREVERTFGDVYGNSAGPYQHLVTTRLRAAEEGITIVRAANTGISAVISPTGTVISFLALNFRGITDVRLPKKLSVPTFYGRYGNFIPLTFCFMNILLAFFLKNRLN